MGPGWDWNVGELYGTVALGWDHTIWNVSASKPLAFEPATWWFPIVGTVPYLGFFEKDEALDQVKALEADGLETYLRTAGAYSTSVISKIHFAFDAALE